MSNTHIACCVHLAGNASCPYPALYRVRWKPHRLKPQQPLIRTTCAFHLAEAINGALDDSARDADVSVRIVTAEDA